MIVSRQVKAKDKGAGAGRKRGKLAQLMDMPLDVFFEARLFGIFQRTPMLICVAADYGTA